MLSTDECGGCPVPAGGGAKIAVDAIAFHSIAVFGVVCACADVVVMPATPISAAVASPTARVASSFEACV